MSTLKRILSVVLGLAVAIIVILAFECGAMNPADFNTRNPKAIAHIVSYMGVNQFLWLLLGYIVGSFLAGIISSLISGREKAAPAIIIGLLLTLGGTMNLIEISHPLWFVITSSLIYLPFSWFGYLAVRSKS